MTGTTTQSSYLHVTDGTWTGTAPIEYTYRWLSCDAAGNNCKDIAGATDNDYYVRDTDVGPDPAGESHSGQREGLRICDDDADRRREG